MNPMQAEELINYILVNKFNEIVSVKEEVSYIANKYLLLQNYPNPFNPSTTIKYSIPQNGFVKLTIYNLLGEVIATLVNEEKSIDIYEVEFDAVSFPSGIYFYRLQAGSFVETKKMVLIK